MLNFNWFDNLIPYFQFSQKSLNKKDIFFVWWIIRDILLNIKTDNFDDVDITLAADPKKLFNQIDQSAGSIFKTDKYGTITIVKKDMDWFRNDMDWWKDKYSDITHKIIWCAMNIHNSLWPWLQEKVYHKAFIKKLKDLWFDVESEKKIEIMLDSENIWYAKCDIIVNNTIAIELKSEPYINKKHFQQLRKYMKFWNYQIGLLINFNNSKLNFHRLMLDESYYQSKSVHNQSTSSKNISFETTPFREEGTYSDSRHPDELKWTNSLLKDSIRRDFTINCLYYNFLDNNWGSKNFKDSFDLKLLDDKKWKEKFLKQLKKNGYIFIDPKLENTQHPILIIQDDSLIEEVLEDGEINYKKITKLVWDFSSLHVVFDPHKWINDILNQKLKAVWNPDNRIQEDALRIIRAIRFVSILNTYEHINLDFDTPTWLSMKRYYFLLRKIAKERIIKEMKKVFTRWNAFWFIALMDELNILWYYFPSLEKCKNSNQPTRYHPFDTYTHTLLCLYHLQEINNDYLVKFGMLYHDVWKPDQYYRASIKKTEQQQQELYKLEINHPVIWEELTKCDFKKLWFSKKEIEQIAFYVRYHMYPGELLSMWENKRKKEIIKFISTYWLEKLLNLCDVTIWDRLGQYNPLQHSNIQWILDLKDEINTIYSEVGRITLKDLKINWKDIISLWISWPKVGEILNNLLEFVLEDERRNGKNVLIQKAKQLLNLENNNK